MTNDMTDTMKCRSIRHWLVCFGLAAFASGCGSTAIISKRGASAPIEATIKRSTSDMVYVETAGSEMGISRDEITDIDHPGNVAATIGGVLTGYGLVNIATGVPQCEREGAAFCTGVFLPAALGGSLLAYGLSVWLGSTSAAESKGVQSAQKFTVVPMASVDKTNQVFGARVHVAF